MIFKLILKLYRNSSNKRKVNYLKKCGCVIGDNVSIICDVSAFSTEPYLIKIGNDVRITSGVKILTHDGASIVASKITGKPYDKFGRVEIGNNVFIGMDSIILPGTKIGSDVIIGAGSVVTKNIENGSVVAGVPARYICSTEEYINKNEESFILTRGMSAKEKKALLCEEK